MPTLNYNTLQAYVNDRLANAMANVIFRENNALWAMLARNRRDFNETMLKTRVQYGKHTNIDNLARGEELAVAHTEIATNARWYPKMFTGSMFIYKEDELENTSDLAIEKLVDGLIENLRMSLEEKAADNLFLRNASHGVLGDTDGWNTLEHLVSDQDVASAPGEIDVGDYSWWGAKRLLAADFSTGDLTNRDDLLNPQLATYLPNIFARMVAQSRYLKGSNAGVIVVPQALWDMLERDWANNKLGSPMDLRVGDATFDALRFRRIPIIADDAMVDAQTGDTDGRIYALDTRYLYLGLNTSAAFTAEEFVRPATANYKTSLVNAYGNIICTNRAAQVVVEGVYSPKSYSA